MSNEPGFLYVVATPIGNLDDITLRASQVLAKVDRVVAEDTRHSRRLLEHLGIRRPMLAFHEHNEDAEAERLLALLLGGESLALVSDAGTPLISDPGFPLVRACRDAGVAVVPVPGPSALIAALSVSGLPTDRFVFHGFLPRRQAARTGLLEGLAAADMTQVFYESSHRIVESLQDLVSVFGADRPAVLARELTKLHETVIMAPLAGLLSRVEADDNQRKGEFVLCVSGCPASGEGLDAEGDRLLRILLDEVPLKQAAALAARIRGGKKNLFYRRALEITGGQER